MAVTSQIHTKSPLIETVYGNLNIQDPFILDLIYSESFQRLKHVNQYGVVNYIVETENYSRFDHSIGVYYLLNKIAVSQEEQIAGLLHDVSHTAFSHVGDYVFEHRDLRGSYQDAIHGWYLKESGLASLLQKHGLTVDQIDPKNSHFKALEKKLPQLCADRIEYNLQGGLRRGLFSQEEFLYILNDLKFEYESWFFTDIAAAEKLSRCSLEMTEFLWGAAWEGLAYRWTAETLKRAFQIKLVSFDEFHFSTDELIWKKLSLSKDPFIETTIQRIKNIHQSFELCKKENADFVIYLKFRGINPLIKTIHGLKPLTELDQNYKRDFESLEQKMLQGWPIKLR